MLLPRIVGETEFKAYAHSKTLDELRDRLVVVRTWALVKLHRFPLRAESGQAQRDDLEQVGFVGLIKAVERYDSKPRVPFEAYARTVVSGEIFHYLRDLAPLLRVPRWYRTLNRQLHESHDRLSRRPAARADRLDELATDMNVLAGRRQGNLRLRDSYNLMSLSERGRSQRGSAALVSDSQHSAIKHFGCRSKTALS